jgi:hypothetical protein
LFATGAGGIGVFVYGTGLRANGPPDGLAL